jgi:hypothetical protein
MEDLYKDLHKKTDLLLDDTKVKDEIVVLEYLYQDVEAVPVYYRTRSMTKVKAKILYDKKVHKYDNKDYPNNRGVLALRIADIYADKTKLLDDIKKLKDRLKVK